MHDLNDLYYFAKVVELGGFSAASRALGIPKSRLSRRLAALEAALEVRLLQRTTRRLTLTEVGSRYLEHCRAMLAAAESAEETILNSRATPAGVLRISSPVALAERQLAPVLPKFMARYPRVSLELLVLNRPVDLVAEGVDVALRVRFPDEQDPNLITRRLFEVPTWVVGAPAFVRRRDRVRAPSDLSSWPALDYERRPQWRFARGGEQQIVSLAPRLAAENFVVLHAAALAGLGVTCLPSVYCQQEIAERRLVRLLPDWDLPVNLVHAVYPTRRGLSPAVRAFVDFLADHLPVQTRKAGGD